MQISVGAGAAVPSDYAGFGDGAILGNDLLRSAQLVQLLADEKFVKVSVN